MPTTMATLTARRMGASSMRNLLRKMEEGLSLIHWRTVKNHRNYEVGNAFKGEVSDQKLRRDLDGSRIPVRTFLYRTIKQLAGQVNQDHIASLVEGPTRVRVRRKD